MKLKILALLTLVIVSCNTSNKVDYNMIHSIDDINENVVKDFYKKVIDSTIINCHLNNTPITKINLDPIKRHYPKILESNDSFFQEQVVKFNNLKWKNIIEKNRILTESDLDSIYKRDWYEEGWKYFQDNFNGKCICSISIPLFTNDFKKAYIDYKSIDESGGLRRIFEYELKEDEWIMVEWN